MSDESEGRLNPAFHFFGLVQKAIADGLARHCLCAGCPELYLLPAADLAYSTATAIEQLAPMCRAAPFDIGVEPAPALWAQVQAARAGRAVAGRAHQDDAWRAWPLSALLWYACACVSSGRLLQGCRADEPVRLLVAPPLHALPTRGDEARLAAFMLENTADLPTIAAATGVALARVVDFYNGCAVLGLLGQEQVFYPGHCLLGLVQKAKADRLTRRVAVGGVVRLIIAPAQNSYHSGLAVADLATLCALPLTALEVGLAAEADEQQAMVQVGRAWVRRKPKADTPTWPPRPLDELVFRAALYGAKGRLPPGHGPHLPVVLAATPDKALLRESAAIAAERHIIALAAFMAANKGASLAQVAAATGQRLPQVVDFYNACLALGLVESMRQPGA